VPEAEERAALLRLSAALATRDPEGIERELDAAARDATPVRVEEAILQSHLFIGFPDAINALALWRARSGFAPPTPAGESCGEWEARGSRVCATVYGGNYAGLRRNVAALHPEMDRWMVEGGYGRVLGRPGLALATRELCIVGLLVVWNVPRQLHSHLRGALNAGASPDEVNLAVETGCGFTSPPAAERARALWNQVRPIPGA
jgi:4-carboxymuconolactone decarboxylase